MAEENFPNLLRGFITITLFAFLLITIVMLFGSNYGKDTTIVTQQFGGEQINKTLQSAKETSDTWYSIFGSQSIFSTIAGIIVTGIFSLAKTMVNFIFTPFAILSDMLKNVIGVPPLVLNILYVLIMISIIFAIWRVITKRL